MTDDIQVNHEDRQQAMAQMPTLTLSPKAEDRLQMEQVIEELEKTQSDEPLAPDVQAAIAKQLDSNLNDEERKTVSEFSKQIDIANAQHVMLYGADAQKKVSDFADTILSDIKNKDAGNGGDMMGKLIGELKSFESTTEKPRGLKALFSTPEKYIAAVRARFETVSEIGRASCRERV